MLRALRLAALLFASAFGSDSPTLHVITYATLESAHTVLGASSQA